MEESLILEKNTSVKTLEVHTDEVSIDAKSSTSFDFIVDNINVSLEYINNLKVPNIEINELNHYPVYILTILDELTRNHYIYNNINNDKSINTISYNSNTKFIKFNELEEYLPLTKDQLENNINKIESSLSTSPINPINNNNNNNKLILTNIMKHYHPGYNPWISPHIHNQIELRSLINDKSITDTYILLKINQFGPKNYFEPLFGCVSLYKINNNIININNNTNNNNNNINNSEVIMKISENFYFDCTPDTIKKEYNHIYNNLYNNLNNDDMNNNNNNSSNKILSGLKSCLFTLPNDLKDQNIFIVFQISKILTCDGDKAITPYLKSNNNIINNNNNNNNNIINTELLKHHELCLRLNNFRQTVGICAIKLFDKQWRVGQHGGANIIAPMHALKSQMNNIQIAQYIRDLYPDEGIASKCKLEVLTDLELKISLYDLGRECQFMDRIPSDVNIIYGDLFNQVIPSQYYNEQDVITISNKFKNINIPINENILIKYILPHIPLSIYDNDDVTRKIRYGIDNTLFLYPISFELLKYRNLCMCIQLIELESNEIISPIITDKYKILNNIYNTMDGEMFIPTTYTKVSYHTKSPSLNDEIKIRLPNVLTKKHYLLFTILHVHVRPKKEKSSILEAMRRVSLGSSTISKEDSDLDSKYITIGHGFLSIINDNNSLINDDIEHNVTIIPVDDDILDAGIDEDINNTNGLSSGGIKEKRFTISGNANISIKEKFNYPFIKIKTISLSSFYSKNKDIQNFLNIQTKPVGILSSTNNNMKKLWQQYFQISNNENINNNNNNNNENLELIFQKLIKQLLDADNHSISNFFYILMRHLLRIICSGYGDKLHSDPSYPSSSRSWAFLVMIHIFGKIAPSVIFKDRMKNINKSNVYDNSNNNNHNNNFDYIPTEEDILIAYVEYMLDEEHLNFNNNNNNEGEEVINNNENIEIINMERNRTISIENCFDTMDEYIEIYSSHVVNECSRYCLEYLIEDVIKQLSIELFFINNESNSYNNNEIYDITTPKLHHNSIYLEFNNNNNNNNNNNFDKNIKNVHLLTYKNHCDLTNMNNVENKLLYNTEKKYFNFLETGNTIINSTLQNPDDIIISTNELDSNIYLDYPTCNHIKEFPARTALNPYHYLLSFQERQNNNIQWWPWLYEVLIYQWYYLLNCLRNNNFIHNNSNNNNNNNKYPISFDELPKSNIDHKDTRILLMDHSPLLFHMIIKSLVLRIHRENKQIPITLDSTLMNILSQLICLIGLEISTRVASQWHYERLNNSLSKFLCELSAILSPTLFQQLILSYSKQIWSLVSKETIMTKTQLNIYNGVSNSLIMEALELQLRLFDHISLLEYFIPINFPMPIDFPIRSILSINPLSCLKNNIYFIHFISNKNNKGIRGMIDPPPSWLVHLLIRESFLVYRRTDANMLLKQYAIGMIRDLIIRQAYDVRYQKYEDIQQIAIMYTPLLFELLKECENLFSLPHDSWERKELLMLFIYLLQNIPNFILREQFRIFANNTLISIKEKINHYLFENNNINNNNNNNNNNIESFNTNISYLNYLHITNYKKHEKNIKTNSLNISSNIIHYLMNEITKSSELFKCLYMLHLILDTFEFPISKGGESGIPTKVLAPGLDAALDTTNVIDSMNNIIDSKAQLENILMQKSMGGGIKRIIKPLPTLTNIVDNNNSGHNSSHNSNKDSNIVNDTKPIAEMRKWRKTAIATNSRNNDNNNNNNNNNIGKMERKYNTLGGTERLHIYNGTNAFENNLRNRKLLAVPKIDPIELLNAAKCISFECSIILLNILKSLLEEGTLILFESTLIKSNNNDNNKINEKLYIKEKELLNILQDVIGLEYLGQIITIILHGLHMQQCEIIIINYLSMIKLIIKRYSGKLIFKSLGDTLQDWIRILLQACTSQSTKIRINACNVFIQLFRCYYYFYGNIEKLIRITLCVLGDVINSIMEIHLHSAHNKAEEFLYPLELSILQMKQVCEKYNNNNLKNNELINTKQFSIKYIEFLKSLTLLYNAYKQLRRQKQIVIIDYNNCNNMLDGPFDTEARNKLTYIKTLYTNGINNNISANNNNKNMNNTPELIRTISNNTIIEDSYMIMELFHDAAKLFHPLYNPRHHIFWLENLTKYQELQGNLAESAELRWKIYQICCIVSENYYEILPSTWDTNGLWSPREPLLWKKGGQPIDIILEKNNNNFQLFSNNSNNNNNNITMTVSLRNFLLSLTSSMYIKSSISCWLNRIQLYQHMETLLKVSAERYAAVNLFSLAERNWLHLINLYRFDENKLNIQKINKIYEKIIHSYKNMNEANLAFAMGSFFRVLYIGNGVPIYLKDKEFIYRNGKQLHVSEFQAYIKEHLLHIVIPGTKITVVSDTHNIPDNVINNINNIENENENNILVAYIVMTNIKPILNNEQSTSNSIIQCLDNINYSNISINKFNGNIIDMAISNNNKINSNNNNNNNNNRNNNIVASSSQAIKFQYSVPFVINSNKIHAKNMDEQGRRIITLTVEEPFPSILSRQKIILKEIRELSPIENSIEDILDRIESMKLILDRAINSGNSSIDINNVMRLVQGTVMPQVNAGVAEVAKIFLIKSSELIINDNNNNNNNNNIIPLKLKYKLQLTLIEFMLNAKKLLELTRKILLKNDSTNFDGIDDNFNNNNNNNNLDSTYIIWQQEMEKAYDALIESLLPYLTILQKNIGNNFNSNNQLLTIMLTEDNLESDTILMARCYGYVKNINLKRENK